MNIYCIHHNDRDGIGAAAVVARMYKGQNIRFFSYNYKYNSDFVKFVADAIIDGDKVYMVDLSIGETNECIDALIESGKLVWIDHHLTSINCEKENDELKDIPGYRSTKYSGAYLTYIWYIKNCMPSTMAYLGDDIEQCDYSNAIPTVIKLIDDHDRFAHEMSDSIFFEDGIQSCDGFDDPNSELWDSLISDDKKLLSEVIERGHVVTDYKTNNFKFLSDNISNISLIVEDTVNKSVALYKGIAINYVSNSLVFGDKYNTASFSMVYRYNGTDKEWKYSIYSPRLDFDCSKVAEHFGGGGHRGAAGFSTKELIIKNDTIHITIK